MKNAAAIFGALAVGFGIGFFVARIFPAKRYMPPIPGDNYGDQKVSEMTRAEMVEAIEVSSGKEYADWIYRKFGDYNPTDEELRNALRQLILQNTSIKPDN